MFFLHGMALAAWFVPLTTVLDSHGLRGIRPYAFASTALAALVSPLIFGALADRHASPVRVLRWLAVATGACMALASLAIERGWAPWVVLGVIQGHALMSAPTWSLSNTIVLSRLENPRTQFGPLRALGTLGWMAGCWLVSGLGADASTRSGFVGSVLWMGLAGFTWTLQGVATPAVGGAVSLRQRLGLDALSLLRNADHRVVFLTAGLVAVPLAAFYPYTPPHLRELGLVRTSAWMSLGQVSEVAAMLVLATLLTRWRLKWIFACGLGFALLRYALCALDGRAWVLAGVSLHGLAFTLFFITAPIYLNERVDVLWRARAQALLTLMTTGMGSLLGYLLAGGWFAVCQGPLGVRWSLFWGGLAGGVGLVFVYFLVAYRGRRGGTASPT